MYIQIEATQISDDDSGFILKDDFDCVESITSNNFMKSEMVNGVWSNCENIILYFRLHCNDLSHCQRFCLVKGTGIHP